MRQRVQQSNNQEHKMLLFCRSSNIIPNMLTIPACIHSLQRCYLTRQVTPALRFAQVSYICSSLRLNSFSRHQFYLGISNICNVLVFEYKTASRGTLVNSRQTKWGKSLTGFTFASQITRTIDGVLLRMALWPIK